MTITMENQTKAFKNENGVRDWILLYVTPWGHTFLTALIISGVTFDGHFPLAFTSPSVLHPYICVARTYIPGHTHLGVTQEVSLTLWGGSNPYTFLCNPGYGYCSTPTLACSQCPKASPDCSMSSPLTPLWLLKS